MATPSTVATDEGHNPPADEPSSQTDDKPDTSNGATTDGDKPSKTAAAPSLAETFKLHASKSSGGEATGSDVSKWCKDAGVIGKTCDAGHIDISFTKVKPKGAKNITFTEMEAFIKELLTKYKADHKISTDDAAKQHITDKLAKTKPKAHGTTKVSKTGGVGRMTDAKSYTGSHKERFDAETGKGKGKEGRTDAVKNTGYVGNYKDAGTYDAKKKPASTVSTAPAKKK